MIADMVAEHRSAEAGAALCGVVGLGCAVAAAAGPGRCALPRRRACGLAAALIVVWITVGNDAAMSP
eukprot:gene16165-29220_t